MTTNGPLRDGQKTITGQLANVLTSVHLMWWFVVIYCLIHCKGKTIDNIIPKNGPRIVYFPALIYGNMSFFPIFLFFSFFFCRNNALLWYLPLWYWKFKQIVEWQKMPFGSYEYVVKSYRRWLMKFNSSQKITKIKKNYLP